MDVSAKINAAVRLVLPVIRKLVAVLKSARPVAKVIVVLNIVVKILLVKTVK